MEHLTRVASSSLSNPVVVGPNGVVTADSTDWRDRMPVLRSGKVTLRELQASDAQALWAFITSDEVTRFLSPPPPTVEGFERFIAWTHRQRAVGMQATLAVVVEGFDTPVGLFQLRQLEPGFGTAEWGFAIGSAFWGTGVFRTGAELMMHLAFDVIGVHRLEARACLENTRGNTALRKIGAVAGGRAAALVPSQRRVSGSGAVDGARRGLAPGQSDLGRRGHAQLGLNETAGERRA